MNVSGLFLQHLPAFLYERLNLLHFYLFEYIIYQLVVLDLLVDLQIVPPLLLDLVLADADHALDRVVVGGVAGVVYDPDAQTLRQLLDGLAFVDAQLIAEQRDLPERVHLPQPLQKRLELVLVHRLVEVHYQLQAPLVGDGRDRGDGFPVVLLDVRAGIVRPHRPIGLRDRRLGGAELVDVYDAVPRLLRLRHLRQRLLGFLANLLLVVGVDALPDVDLLLLDAGLSIHQAQVVQRDLHLREPPMEEPTPLLQAEAGPILQGRGIDQVVEMLLRQLGSPPSICAISVIAGARQDPVLGHHLGVLVLNTHADLSDIGHAPSHVHGYRAIGETAV